MPWQHPELSSSSSSSISSSLTLVAGQVGASNELPESEELDALYDRFLIRRQARPCHTQAAFGATGAELLTDRGTQLTAAALCLLAKCRSQQRLQTALSCLGTGLLACSQSSFSDTMVPIKPAAEPCQHVQVSQVSPQGVAGMLQASLASQGSALGGVSASPDTSASNGAELPQGLLPPELFRSVRCACVLCPTTFSHVVQP